MEREGQDILTFSWPQREDKCHTSVVFHLQSQDRNCMEGVDNSIDLRMLLQNTLQELTSVHLKKDYSLTACILAVNVK
jgi:hypothetical protein